MHLTIPMIPVAKGRPRVCQKNGRTWTYTDSKTVNAEKFIKACCIGLERFTEGQPLKMDIGFYFIRPKGAKKRLYPPGDIDNYCKCLIDGLQGNGGIIPDDKQVTELRATKRYGESTRIEVEIMEVK